MNLKLIKEPNLRYSTIEQILTNRGIPLSEIDHYLNTTDSDLTEAELYNNMREGVFCLITHLKNKDKIFIQVDSDCDGVTSSAFLLNYLYRIFPTCVSNQIVWRLHEGKQHGIILDVIPDDCKLVIVPDAGSNDYEQHKILKEKGIDIIVIDHHEAEYESKDAIIINNQLSEYGTKSLSGVGMVYKFCSYIDKILNLNNAEQDLDLVALGLIADVMSLRDFETKHLINKGIKNIKNPFFNEMSKKNSFSLGNVITPIGVAFYIAPYVNAVIRVGTQEEKEVLFKSMLNYEGYKLIPSTKRGCKGQLESTAEQATRVCTNVKNRQLKLQTEGLEKIKKRIEQDNLLDNQILIIPIEEKEIDTRITGLIANKLMSEYQRPVLLLHKRIHEDGTITFEGSGRGYDKSNLNNLKDFLSESGLVMYAAGHQSAFGTGIREEDIVDFVSYSNEELSDFDFSSCYNVDYLFESNDFNSQIILDIASCKSLWGKDIDESLIGIKNIIVTKQNLTLMSPMKNPTLKITLPNKVALIKFHASDEEYDSLISNGYIKINIVGTCEINEYNGRVTPQIMIKEYEITEISEYDF